MVGESVVWCRSTKRLKFFMVKVRAVTNEIQGKFSGKDEFLRRKKELSMQLDDVSKKVDVLQAQNIGILGQVGDGGCRGLGDAEGFSEYNKGRGRDESMIPIPVSLSLKDQCTKINEQWGASEGSEKEVIPLPSLN